MPWDYKTDKPDAVKYLHPKIQRKAIAIANRIVESGGDEGMAIATGIKRAKGLVKLSAIRNPNVGKELIKAIEKGDKDYLVKQYEKIIELIPKAIPIEEKK